MGESIMYDVNLGNYYIKTYAEISQVKPDEAYLNLEFTKLNYLKDDKIKLNFIDHNGSITNKILYLKRITNNYFLFKYYGIKIPPNTKEVYIDHNKNINYRLKLTKQKEYTIEQMLYFKSQNVIFEEVEEMRLTYKLEKSNNPNRILVTFPKESEIYSPVTFITTDFPIAEMEDSIKISFIDNFGEQGTYMSIDENGKFIDSSIAEKIRRLQKQYDIPTHRVIFYGIGKGATIGLRYIDLFPEASFFLGSPQLAIRHFSNTHNESGITPYVDFIEKQQPNFNNLFLSNGSIYLSLADKESIVEFQKDKVMNNFIVAENENNKDIEHSLNNLVKYDINNIKKINDEVERIRYNEFVVKNSLKYIMIFLVINTKNKVFRYKLKNHSHIIISNELIKGLTSSLEIINMKVEVYKEDYTIDTFDI